MNVIVDQSLTTMRICRGVVRVVVVGIVLQIWIPSLTVLAAGETQSGASPYVARFWRLPQLDGHIVILALDLSGQYIAQAGYGIEVWKCGTNFSLTGPVYSSKQLDRRSQYEVVSFATTSQGFMWVGDHPYHNPDKPATELLLFDSSTGAIRELNCDDDLKGNFASPDGSKIALLTRHYDEKLDMATFRFDIRDVNDAKLNTVTVDADALGEIRPPIMMDSRGNFYMARARSTGESGLPSERLLFGVVVADQQQYHIISGTNEVFSPSRPSHEKSDDRSSLYRVIPSFLQDGLTVVTYLLNESSGQYAIKYYRNGTLVRSVDDPVPTDAAERRLAITADGKRVLTQRVSGETKDLLGAWDIDTGRYSELMKLPPIYCVFPSWVQGKYAPVWCTQDGQACQAAILEITPVAGSDLGKENKQ